MFPLAARGRFNFDARNFAIQSVEHAENQRDAQAGQKVTVQERQGGQRAEEKPENCDLVRRDFEPAQARDDGGLDRRVHVGGKIERAFLRRIQHRMLNHRARFRCDAQAHGRDLPAHRFDVSRLGRAIDAGDRSALDRARDDLAHILVVRTSVEKGGRKAPQSACARFFPARRGIDQCGIAVIRYQRGQQPAVAIDVARNNE